METHPTALEMYLLADYVMLPELKTAMFDFISRLFSSIASMDVGDEASRVWWKCVCESLRMVYDHTGTGSEHWGIRKVHVDGWRDCLVAGYDAAALGDLMEEGGNFARDMFMAIVEHRKSGRSR